MKHDKHTMRSTMRATANKATRRTWLILLCGGMVSCLGLETADVLAAPQNQVVTYPAPPGEAVTGDYRVEWNGKPVDVYLAETEYFDKKITSPPSTFLAKSGSCHVASIA